MPTAVWWTPVDRRIDDAMWRAEVVARWAIRRGSVATLERGGTARGRSRVERWTRVVVATCGERGVIGDAYDAIRQDVLAQVERRHLRPEGDLDEVKLEVQRAVDEYQRVARLGDVLPLAVPSTMVDRILRSITDLGPLTDLMARRDVEEIFVEGARVSFLDGTGRLRGLTEPTSEEENRQLLDRLLGATERQLNTRHPMVQARVLDGTARLDSSDPSRQRHAFGHAAAVRGAQRDP